MGFYIKSNNKINPITSVWVRWPLSRTFCLVCLFVTTRQWCLVGVHWNSQVLVLKQNIRLMTNSRNRGSLLRKTLPKEEATRHRGMFRSSSEPLLSRPYRIIVGGSLFPASSFCCQPPWGGRFSGHSLCSFLFSYSNFVLALSFVFLPHVPQPLSSPSLYLLNSPKAPRVC